MRKNLNELGRREIRRLVFHSEKFSLNEFELLNFGQRLIENLLSIRVVMGSNPELFSYLLRSASLVFSVCPSHY